jgi:hypothetical protein
MSRKPKEILHLTLHQEFFAAIVAGTKKTEYRECKPYWRSRIEGRNYDLIQFRNGYATDAPMMQMEYRGYKIEGQGHGKKFAIRLGRILKLKNWR